MQKSELVMAIGDLHTPFEHPDALHFLKEVKRKEGPTHIVNVGDEIDAHALGNYDHDPDGFSAGHELIASINSLRGFYKLFPKCDVMESNHTARPYKLAYRVGLSRQFLRDYKEFLQAPKGWNWHESIEIDGVKYEHGEGQSGANGAIRAAVGNMRSTVIGHIHAFAGVQYSANPRYLIFGFNVGCLIDKDKYAFAYGKKIKHKPILGVGLVERGVPRFIPMELNTRGRWVGKL